jgi:molecular chaperone DnaJ
MRDTHSAAREARALLGVSQDADPEQILRAYRRRALVVHPDVNTAQDAGAQFSALRAAYQLLLQASRRPAPAPTSSQDPIVDRVDRHPMPASGPARGWPDGRAGRDVAWLVARPVRVSRPGRDDGTNRTERGHE